MRIGPYIKVLPILTCQAGELCAMAVQLWALNRLVHIDNTATVAHINHISSSHVTTRPLRLLRSKWRLHPQMVQLRSRFGQVQIDLFALQESYSCPLWYSLTVPCASI